MGNFLTEKGHELALTALDKMLPPAVHAANVGVKVKAGATIAPAMAELEASRVVSQQAVQVALAGKSQKAALASVNKVTSRSLAKGVESIKG